MVKNGEMMMLQKIIHSTPLSMLEILLLKLVKFEPNYSTLSKSSPFLTIVPEYSSMNLELWEAFWIISEVSISMHGHMLVIVLALGRL